MNKFAYAIGVTALCLSGLAFYLGFKMVEDNVSFSPRVYNESARLLNDYQTDKNLNPPNYDTIKVKSKTINNFLKKQSKSTFEAAIEFMRENSISIDKEFCYLYDAELYDLVLKFNAHPKIPLPIYLGLLPEKDAQEYFSFEASQQIVTRKFERCYGFNELEEHWQLIVIGKGALFPSVHFLTYSKDSMELVSERIIYKMENVENEKNKVFRIKSCLENEFRSLTEFKIIEGNSTKYFSDTVVSKYYINGEGEIF